MPKPQAWRLKWLGIVGMLMMVVACLWWWADSEDTRLQNTWNQVSLSMGWASSPAMQWRLDFTPQPADSQLANTTDPEHLVRQIYAHLGEGERAQALATASVLVERFPTFQLGQLLYADLLNISSAKPVAWPDNEELNAPSLRKRLDELILESKRRLQRDSAQSLQGKIPTALTFLSPQQTYVAAVDASKSRLYWFENRSGPDGRLQLHLVKETYISVGINGVGKHKEGDGKTPLGVYFILRNLPGEGLPDLFGVGALTLNYPNAVDLMRKKTGSGIWLHGTPSAQYARAPESTDGCVVLSNPDLERLLETVQVRTTPVVIAPSLQWVKPDALAGDLAQFEAVLASWRQTRGAGNLDELKTFYSQRFMSQGRDLAQWWPRVETELRANGSRELQMKDLSVLRWRDQEDTMVVTFGEVATGQTRGVTKRQYWVREQDRWTIFFEGTI